MTARQAATTGDKKEGEVGDDDEIPDLVENFDEADKEKSADLEQLE